MLRITMDFFRSAGVCKSFGLFSSAFLLSAHAVIPLATVVALVYTDSVAAQTGVLEEVVVTSRKREETFMDIPVSGNIFTESEIEAAGINIPHDFIGLTPNVTVVQTQNAGNSFINIRGISQARNSEMSVAVLIDGVLLSNPAQFNQQLFDIEQIEVLRGPQGALYGRNAIGGAIVINTRKPADEFEGKLTVGVDGGPGFKVQGSFSTPVTDTLNVRGAISYLDTDGWIDNPFLNEEADPYEDISGKFRAVWEPTENFTADARASISRLDTQALYFNIEANANDTSLPVRVNNAGVNERDMETFSLKLDYETGFGTFTSVTAYDSTEELLTGDQFNFLPRPESFANFFADLGDANPGLDPTADFFSFVRFLTGDEFIDLSQTQYLEVEAWSQEIRFTSPAENRFRWIVGSYFIWTDRFISTGNQIDRGNGVFPVRRTPRPSVFIDPADPSPQLGLLVDAQDNFAWAVFADATLDVTDRLEASFSLRYDRDNRKNITLTEPLFDPTFLGLVPGTTREKSWDELQPKFTLRYKFTDNMSAYAGYSRGFRSGGFNQTGVGAAVPEPGVEDLFEEQTADTIEVGFKGQFFDNRLRTSFSAYYTDFDNAYFFFFDPGTSTQNLGNIDNVEYLGFEFQADAVITDNFNAYVGVGFTDSEIEEAADPADVGNEAPLVSNYTVNVGGQYRQPLNITGGFLGNMEAIARVDYQLIGQTWWDPGNISSRRPVDILDVRFGLQAPENWSLVFWSKNAFDEKYNAEFSPGPAPGANFLFKAPPRSWGVEFTKYF